MYFTNIVCYRREGDKMVAYRVQRAHGYSDVRVIPFAPLFAGHCTWIADDIADYERRMATRSVVRETRKAA